MNGIHDMGGMEGFGPVVRERDEPVFHDDWEKRVFVLANRLIQLTGNVDEFRHAIERIPPARYLDSSYYERWLQAIETLLVERGLLSREEMASLSAAERAAADVPPAEVQPSPMRAPKMRAKYQAGDVVRVRNINPHGHTRCPRYVRGKTGVIRRDHGNYVFPDTNAHRAGEKRQRVYSVELTAHELWGKAGRERILIDLWEDYLEPAQKRLARSKSAKASRTSPTRSRSRRGTTNSSKRKKR